MKTILLSILTFICGVLTGVIGTSALLAYLNEYCDGWTWKVFKLNSEV